MRNSKYPTVSIEPAALVRGCTLEFSPKPIFRKDDEFLTHLFTELFRTYRQLLKHAERVSILWWLSEGTDILEYDGDMSRRIEWAKWQGFAHTVDNGSNSSRPATLYTEHPVEFTYGDIRRIVARMKEACAAVLGKKLSVIVPFDPGSEFCISPFRYVRHTELLMGRENGSFVHCIDALARFHADPARFAAYPDGIPEGTIFGEFLGRQAQAYLTDMGMDGIWLSNSFGFGRSPYASAGTGAFFDGERFSQDGNIEVRDGVMEFWKLFRAGCPDFEVRCRGTDFTVGVNMVNHASPYRELYKDNAFKITPPPNTPWSALTHNHGVSLAGYLTQNAPFPGECMPLRFYTTDIFFCNNPWFDRWDRSPHDIYLNASQCVFNPDGSIRTANEFLVEGVDGSWGELPSEVPDETIPHFKRALALRPDAPPPLLWVYPFDEYCEYVFGKENRMSEPYGGDFSIIGAINETLPIGGAVTTAALPAARKAHGDAFAATVLLTPPPDPGSEWEKQLLAHLAAGGSVLCYGSMAHAGDEWKKLVGVETSAAALSGEFAVSGGGKLFHDELVGQGGLAETAAPGTTVLASAEQGGETRALATVKGRVAWVRGGTSITRDGARVRRLETRDRREWFAPESLFVKALSALGWVVERKPGLMEGQSSVFIASRHAGGFIFTGYCPDDEEKLRLRAPFGAPVPLSRNVRICEDGASEVPVKTSFHDEVRVFVRQKAGVVGCHGQPVINEKFIRRWRLTGLDDATVRFYVEPDSVPQVETTGAVECGDKHVYMTPGTTTDATGTWFELEHVSNAISIGW